MHEIPLRTMQPSDIPRCQELRAMVGWNQTEIDWQRFISFNPQGCFVAERNGIIVGTVCTIAYDNGFGWVAMVIVDPAMQRKGIGKALLNRGIEHLCERGLTVKLDATPAGKLLYDSLGFVDEYNAARMEWDVESPPEVEHPCSSLSKQDLDTVVAFDAPIFGSPRRHVIQSYFENYPDFVFGEYRDKMLQGYIMAREGTNAFHIGPWVANEPETAKRLLYTLLDTRKPERVFIDIVEPNPNTRAMLENLGFREQRPLIRMFLGENHSPGTPQYIYGMSGPELG